MREVLKPIFSILFMQMVLFRLRSQIKATVKKMCYLFPVIRLIKRQQKEMEKSRNTCV